MKQRLERGNKMKRKNGFTLIELLAVIVILAIIALIAVPVVMNIIEKANKSAFKDSAYGIIKAGETFYTSELLKDAQGIKEEKTFTFPNDIEGLEIKGSKPTGGNLVVNNKGQVSMAITNGKYCITKGFEDDDVTIKDGDCGLSSDESSDGSNASKTLSALATTYSFKKVDNETNATATAEEVTVPICITNKTKCEEGTPVAVEVAPNLVYKFYVINDDLAKNEVTLIMDRNLGEKVAWVTKSDYNDDTNYGGSGNNNKGPITAINYLNAQTSDWDNIPAISNYEYDGNAGTCGYQKLEIVNGTSKLTSKDSSTVTEITGVSKARLLTYEEATSAEIGCDTYIDGSCPSWIYGNLSEDNTPEKPYGYWLLTAYPSFSDLGRVIDYVGVTSFYVYDDLSYGVRPVITLSK